MRACANVCCLCALYFRYKKGETGKLLWDPTLISPVCLGSIWERDSPWVCLDSRVQHPASFMHHEDLTPGQAMDPATIDLAMISPIFAGTYVAVQPAMYNREVTLIVWCGRSSAVSHNLHDAGWSYPGTFGNLPTWGTLSIRFMLTNCMRKSDTTTSRAS